MGGNRQRLRPRSRLLPLQTLFTFALSQLLRMQSPLSRPTASFMAGEPRGQSGDDDSTRRQAGTTATRPEREREREETTAYGRAVDRGGPTFFSSFHLFMGAEGVPRVRWPACFEKWPDGKDVDGRAEIRHRKSVLNGFQGANQAVFPCDRQRPPV